MKKLFTILAVSLCSILAMAQTNQYFWYNGNLIMGNPINQVDSITFGQLDNTDSITLYFPHTIKVIHDTIIKYVKIHDTINLCDVPDGALSGIFSVSDSTSVYFSKGNLQYQASTQVWRFAGNQYDYIGNSNANISSTYTGWIDLFGFGTSGYQGVNPYEHSTSTAPYLKTNITNTEYDWGIHNAISNGGNIKGMWYTLSNNEWQYLLQQRTNANQKAITATVNGVKGYILLPDVWNSQQNITPTQSSFTINQYSIDQWETLEEAGAVFLPAANTRNGTYMYGDNYWGNYWSTTFINGYTAYDFSFSVATPQAQPSNIVPIYYGRSVRLVTKTK